MPKASTFKDRVKLYVAAGNGGDGCVSFRREKYVPKGGPDGGDGGRGGHVIFVADKDTDSLLPLYFRPHQKAEHGGKGQRKQCTGKCGDDLYIKVPCGTDIHEFASKRKLSELVKHEETFRVARGGRGGKGNIHYKTSTHQAPREFTEGTPGQELVLQLELKLVADVGLVGYPNAGKSTLLRAISAAKPKTASYPFTTLNPIIGTLIFDDYDTLRVADIPGLIDGAHAGIGLGHDFLRHIERTRFLLFVLDMAGVDGRSPLEDYNNLRKELRLYREDLERKPSLVLANKMDVEEAELYLEEFVEETGITPMSISALEKSGTDEVKAAIRAHFQKLEDDEVEDASPPATQ